MNLFRTVTRGALLLSIATVSLLAAPITGTLNIGGSAAVTLTTIDFLPPGALPGDFAVDPFTQVGGFVYLAGTAGKVTDLDSAVYPTGVPILVSNWMTFLADPTLQFDLTLIKPGDYTAVQCGTLPAVGGQNCTIPGSPFNLSNSGVVGNVSSTVTFGVSGVVRNTVTLETSKFDGTFSTQFVGVPYQSLLSILNGGGSVAATYSANFAVSAIPEVPEPATFALSGLGLLGLAMLGRRFSR